MTPSGHHSLALNRAKSEYVGFYVASNAVRMPANATKIDDEQPNPMAWQIPSTATSQSKKEAFVGQPNVAPAPKYQDKASLEAAHELQAAYHRRLSKQGRRPRLGSPQPRSTSKKNRDYSRARKERFIERKEGRSFDEMAEDVKRFGLSPFAKVFEWGMPW